MSYIKNFLIETTEIYDHRTNKSTDRFFAGTIKHKLILKDEMKDSFLKYDYKHDQEYDTQIIIDTKHKTLEFPKMYTASYSNEDFIEKYTANEQYIKRFYNDLLKHGIIDTSYTIHHDIEKHYKTGKLVLYHGTSSSVVDRIKRLGLTPIDTTTLQNEYLSMYRGNRSTIQNHTTKNIYLTPSKKLAVIYAKNQAKKRNDIPVVVEVVVPDNTKLMVDDDFIREKINKLIKAILLYKIEVKDENFNEFFSTIMGMNILDIIILDIRREIEELQYLGIRYGYEEKIEMILQNVKDQYEDISKSNYFKSLMGSDNAVAYRGRIPAKFLSYEEIKIPIKEQSGFSKLNNIQKAMKILQS